MMKYIKTIKKQVAYNETDKSSGAAWYVHGSLQPAEEKQTSTLSANWNRESRQWRKRSMQKGVKFRCRI